VVITVCVKRRFLKLWVATRPPTINRLSRQCESLDVSQLNRPSWPVSGIALFLFFFYAVSGAVICPSLLV
jgi:hypothetical protein